MLEAAVVTELAEVARTVYSRLCVSGRILGYIFDERLRELGVHHYSFKARTARSFMRQLEFSFRKPKGKHGKEWTPKRQSAGLTETVAGLTETEEEEGVAAPAAPERDPVPAVIPERPDRTFSRFMALRIVYGSGPPRGM